MVEERGNRKEKKENAQIKGGNDKGWRVNG
jgi:hypothetical protein